MSTFSPFTSNFSLATYGPTTEVPSSSMAAPTTVKFLSANFFWNSISQGISIWQGSHQVAQKFTTTTLPFRLASVTSFPSNPLNVTSGAGLKVFGSAFFVGGGFLAAYGAAAVNAYAC